MEDRLHPTQATIASRANMLLRERRVWERNVRIAAFVQFQRTVDPTRPYGFVAVRHIYKEFRDLVCRLLLEKKKQSRPASSGETRSVYGTPHRDQGPID